MGCTARLGPGLVKCVRTMDDTVQITSKATRGGQVSHHPSPSITPGADSGRGAKASETQPGRRRSKPLFGACVCKIQLEGQGQTGKEKAPGGGVSLSAFPSLAAGPAISSLGSSAPKKSHDCPAVVHPDTRPLGGGRQRLPQGQDGHCWAVSAGGRFGGEILLPREHTLRKKGGSRGHAISPCNLPTD